MKNKKFPSRFVLVCDCYDLNQNLYNQIKTTINRNDVRKNSHYNDYVCWFDTKKGATNAYNKLINSKIQGIKKAFVYAEEDFIMNYAHIMREEMKHEKNKKNKRNNNE